MRSGTTSVYPDGSNIDLFFSTKQHGTISDLGNTLNWLDHLGISQPWNTKQRKAQVQAALAGLGCEQVGGAIKTNMLEDEHPSLSALRLAQACSRVSDLYLTKRQQAPHFRELVEEAVGAFQYAYEAGVPLKGRTGKEVRVDLLIDGPRHKSAVLCIEPTKSAATETHFKWHSLELRDEKRITVYNDSGGKELEADLYEYLTDKSLVLPFSADEEFRSALAA